SWWLLVSVSGAVARSGGGLAPRMHYGWGGPGGASRSTWGGGGPAVRGEPMKSGRGVGAIEVARGADLPQRSVARELSAFTRRNPLAAAGGLVGFLIVVMALTAPLIAPSDPLKADFRPMAKPPD